jgi:hypothetical protein
MKLLKDTMLFTIGCLSLLIAGISSCSKTPLATPPPTITSITGLIAPGNTITVNGTNFTNIGISVTINSVPVAVEYISPTAIDITIPPNVIAPTYNFIITTGGLTSNTFQTSLTTLTSDSVAVANLIAHWSFDNTNAELISTLTPTTTGTTGYIAGQIGNAISFNNAYLVYPVIPNINHDTALAAGFTLTMWAKLPVVTTLTSLWQLNGNTGSIWGLAALATRVNASDTLDFDGTMTNYAAGTTHTSDSLGFEQGYGKGLFISNTAWEFLTMTYDSTTKELNYYGNGAFLSSSVLLDTTLSLLTGKFTLVTTATNPGTSTNQVSFGTFDVTAAFPNAGATGSGSESASLPAGTYIDDTRLFNTTLNIAQIDSLYSLGVAGK